MKLIPSSCANCSAPLRINPALKSVTCEHCGSELLVKRDKPKKRNKKDPDIVILENENENVYTEVVQAVAAVGIGAAALGAGAEAMSAGSSFFEFIGNIFAYAKLILILIVLAAIFGLCVVPSYLVYLFFNS
jgi:DNA-directed RNA polymerase subunit RPC12/RpoP